MGRKVKLCGDKPCLNRCIEGGSLYNFSPCSDATITFEDGTTVPMVDDDYCAVGTPTIGDVTATLAERGSRYGSFKDQAVYAQGMAEIARNSRNWSVMAPDQREGLSIIFNKIGRILNGDPDYSDSWHDIAGYATLVDKRLKAEGK